MIILFYMINKNIILFCSYNEIKLSSFLWHRLPFDCDPVHNSQTHLFSRKLRIRIGFMGDGQVVSDNEVPGLPFMAVLQGPSVLHKLLVDAVHDLPGHGWVGGSGFISAVVKDEAFSHSQVETHHGLPSQRMPVNNWMHRS